MRPARLTHRARCDRRNIGVLGHYAHLDETIRAVSSRDGEVRAATESENPVTLSIATDSDDHMDDEMDDAMTSHDTVLAVADSVRSTLDTPGTTLPEALGDVRGMLAADGLAFLCISADSVDAYAPIGQPALMTPELMAEILELHDDGHLDVEHLTGVATRLGLTGEDLRLGIVGPAAAPELLLLSYEEDLAPEPEAIETVAGYVSVMRLAMDSRRESIDKHLRRERTQWAHEIHDGATQSLTAAVLHLESLRARLMLEGEETLANDLEHAQDGIKTSLAELRKLISDLSDDHAVAGVADVSVPLRDYVDDIVARWRLPARVVFTQDPDCALPPSLVDVAQVVVREALANAAKHSGARQVSVRVRNAGSGVQVEIADNGRGFAPETIRTEGAGHFGLRLVRRRVEEKSGTFEIRSRPGSGTTVIARFGAT